MDEKEFELAEQLAASQLAESLMKVRRTVLPPAAWNGKDCAICEEILLAARVGLGFHVCVECKTREECFQRLGL